MSVCVNEAKQKYFKTRPSANYLGVFFKAKVRETGKRTSLEAEREKDKDRGNVMESDNRNC